MDSEVRAENAMRVQTHQPARRGRPSKRDTHRTRGRTAAQSAREKQPYPFETSSDRLDDGADYEQIIRDFVSVHDAIVAADEYDS
jgi:hypothetical protein